MKMTGILGLLTWAVGNGTALAAVVNCQVTFELNSAKVDPKAVSVCVDVLGLQAGDAIRVDGFASEAGTASHNQKLSEARARAVKNALHRQLKGLKIEAKGRGERATEGRVVVLSSEKAEAVADAGIPGTKVAALGSSDAISIRTAGATEGQPSRWRAAVRGGFDRTRVEARDVYFAPGLDIAYLPSVPAHLRVELGALANLYAEGNRNRFDSYHFAPMVGFQRAGYVAGIRGLAGAVHSYDAERTYTDTGAELRLGVERGPWSLFLGAGRSSTLNRMGMDFGMRF